MRTSLGKVKGLGSARNGSEHFWYQRLTAVANIPLSIFFVWLMVYLNGANYESVRETLSLPIVAIVLVILLGSFLFHMRLGMQMIIEDYIHGEFTKIIFLMLNTYVTIFIGIAGIFAILKISLS